MEKTTSERKKWIVALAITFAILLLCNLNVVAIPSGATISFNSTSIAQSKTPANLTDQKGTINTLRISATQQNTRWKAYVGNISGKLTLDDANDYTIYDWTSAAVTGEVYASRNVSINWASVNCSNNGNLSAEQSAVGMQNSDSDSIYSTFNWSGHRNFAVGAIPISGCNSTATYMNDTNPGQSSSALFHEAILTDGSSLIYAAIVNKTGQGYRNDSLYDFQMIVADNTSAGSPPLTYFFYLELI